MHTLLQRHPRLFEPLPCLFRPRAAAVEFEVGLPVAGRLLSLAELVEQVGNVPMGVGIVGVNVQRDLERLQC